MPDDTFYKVLHRRFMKKFRRDFEGGLDHPDDNFIAGRRKECLIRVLEAFETFGGFLDQLTPNEKDLLAFEVEFWANAYAYNCLRDPKSRHYEKKPSRKIAQHAKTLEKAIELLEAYLGEYDIGWWHVEKVKNTLEVLQSMEVDIVEKKFEIVSPYAFSRPPPYKKERLKSLLLEAMRESDIKATTLEINELVQAI